MKKFILLFGLLIGLVTSNAQCDSIVVYKVDTLMTLDNGSEVQPIYYVSKQQFTGDLSCGCLKMDVSAYLSEFAVKAGKMAVYPLNEKTLTRVTAIDCSIDTPNLSPEDIPNLKFETGEYRDVFAKLIAKELGINVSNITHYKISKQ